MYEMLCFCKSIKGSALSNPSQGGGTPSYTVDLYNTETGCIKSIKFASLDSFNSIIKKYNL